ncbi:Clp protease N-terminal domain-containing protein [Actinopolymorpha pittospori]|uniref:ATP-dependent Clp protease ATP-binding subunit ClpA n=1 Tax=Actinopolymorpha pittospori TaxID=648752 RepID=A0A927MNC6_9ACTN|nr:Clp protease N-terminal domain-containing protein [Actinopolymorpha pittospori]MBE1603875.1 ATP-dependent Clp protease ATP-binding subunit ClpA [Actinopolymorpha pittospori]
MFEQLPQPTRQVMELADQESDRMRHSYIGCEHVLAALARYPADAAAVLARHGLDVDAIRSDLERLVEEGILPPPWRNDADLLRSLGVDLAAVRHNMESTFGAEALERATRKASRRTGWHGLTGKPILFKRALQLAGEERQRLGYTETTAEHILLGVLKDAQDPIEKPRCFNNPWMRRKRAQIGLPHRGPSPVKLIVQARGASLPDLYQAVAAELHAPA